ncbi:MAG: class I SAM-dependent methyltransferase [Gammaproteobacteria bacterium]
MNPDACGKYADWKGWKTDLAPPNPNDSESFRIEVARSTVAPPARVLEIGFGEGRFLDWARDAGFDVFGIEIIPALCEAADSRGHTVYSGDVLRTPVDGKFDLIVAFDVVEHIARDRQLEFFARLGELLSPEGRILLRFPNGASPFGRIYQYGDITHETVVSPDLIGQIAHMCGLRLLWGGNAARTPASNLGGRIAKSLAYGCRNIIERILGRLYFGGRRIPLDLNATVVLAKAKRAAKRG